MGYFTISEASQLPGYAENPTPHARIYVYVAGTETLTPVFRDSDLTFMQANPVEADETGAIGGFYLADGLYRIVIRDRAGRVILEEDEIPVLTSRRTEVARSFRLVEDMLEDRSLCYRQGVGLQTVQEGDVIHVYQDSFSYRVLPETSDDPHLSTAGGVRLAIAAGSKTVTPAQFGADLTGQRDSGPALQAMLDYLAEHGGYARITGVLRVEFPQTPKDPSGAAALYLPVAKSRHPTVLNFSGAVINYIGAPDSYLLRAYQSGNSASWRGLEVLGGYFDGTGTVDPAGCLLWDDLGNSRSHGCQFNGWQRAAGHENAYAIHQRNYDTWSENNTHENHSFNDCDTWIHTSLAPEGGWSSSMARTRIENLFGSNCKAYAIINSAGMYDSVIRNIKGNGQRIATILNTGGAIGNSHLEEIKTEQGRPVTQRNSGAMTAGGNSLLLASETGFSSWMAQGQPVRIAGAGAGGATLETWITGHVSGSEVTVHHPAATTVTDATVTLAATACYEDRSSLHQFAFSKMYNRDGGLIQNTARFTGADTSLRETTFGALAASSTVTGTRFRSSRSAHTDQVVTNMSADYLYPIRTLGKTMPDATTIELLGVAETQIAGNACWRITLYGTEGQLFGECLTFRRQGTMITGLMLVATVNVTFSLSNGALIATQSTGASVSARMLVQRLA